MGLRPSEQEKTCTQDGIYSRTDATTGLKQYMLIPTRGHDMPYESVVEIEPTCTTSGQEVVKCYLCDYKEVREISELGHNFSGQWVIIEEAHGAKIGTKEISCTRCDAKTTKQYMDAVYPTGNIKVEFVWDNRAYVSSADRTEIHWQLDENKYCFYVMRESSGHSSGNYVHFYFYYEDNGPHSPVYIKKMVGDKYYNQQNKYGSYGWGIVGYVDSFDDFVEYIDSAMKGNDNGLNNSGLHTVYQMWEDIFNERGCIPSSYYCDGIVEYRGYTCTIYSNGDFYYYVTEDNCCLSYGGLGYNRDQAYVENIEAITNIPHGPVDYDQVKYIMINIEDGDEDKFTDQYYFQVENLNQRVEIYEDRYISKRLDVAGYEVQLADGTWAKIEELTQSGNWWKGDETFTYMSIVEKYLDGKYPDCLEIRAILVDAPLPVHVKVINGTVSSNSDYKNYGSENDFPANEEVCFNPEYDESKYTVKAWRLDINGEIIVDEYCYLYDLVLPESGTVIAECILEEYGAAGDGVRVTINVVGNGTLSHETGSYPEFDPLTISANAQRKQRFVGWFVQGLPYRSEGDDYPSGSFNEDYYQYGEFFGNKPVFNFSLADRYDEVVITAIFEEVSADTNYIDIIIQDGFVSTYSYNSLTVSALRLTEPDYISIYGLFTEEQNISGWIVTEQTEEGPVQTQLDGKFTDYYFTVDSTLTPIEVTEGEGE